jgi:catechol 2,3-dioxygenase-like lactoylglutathione lyase family enzyme
MTKALHHMAFRCRDSEETRRFYEDIIGIPLTASYEITETKTGRPVEVLHTFFRLTDGSHIAFFEVPDSPFEFKEQHDFDLHIALESTPMAVERAVGMAKAKGLPVRGPADHEFIKSVYFRDPNGYVVELSLKEPDHDQWMAEEAKAAKPKLDDWTKRQRAKAKAAS